MSTDPNFYKVFFLKKVYFVGVPGFPNYGDELIFLTWVKFIREYYPNTEIWIDCPDVGKFCTFMKNYGIDFSNIYVTDNIWSYCSLISFQVKKKMFKKISSINWLRYIDDISSKINIGACKNFTGLDVVSSADAIHIIGGGYINSIWPGNYGVLIACASIKKKYKMPIYMTGAGLMPANVEIFDQFSSTFDYIEGRDIESSYLTNVEFGLDDAYLAVGLPNTISELKNYPDIMVCIQSDLTDSESFSRTVAHVEEKLLEYQCKGLTIGYVEAIPFYDRKAYDILSRKIRNITFFDLTYVLNKGLPANKNQKWITSRFHHHLIASSVGAKGTFISLKI